jgi:hypothetical protein
MIIGTIFDWVLMVFLAGSGLAKVSGMERKASAGLGVDYGWIILVGLLQLAAIYFVYVGQFVPVLVLVVIPYLFFVVRCVFRKEYFFTAVLLGISALIAVRWLSIGHML